MIPYGRQDISQADIDAVVEVLRSDFLTQGPIVPNFERAVAENVKARDSMAVNSATSALHIACLALGLGEKDWLWTSPNSFVASANCARYCGAQVDFVDIDISTYNMCVKSLARKLEQAKLSNRLPKIVIPVHFSGQSCDMSEIYALSQQYGFRIIEDASHAIGGKYNDESIGSCRFSDITIFSFHPVKIITSGEGGMAVTNDDVLASRMRLLRSHGVTRDRELMNHSDGAWYYQQVDLGFNYRMTELQAALGLSQLSRLDEFVLRRNELAERYDNLLHGSGWILPAQRKGVYSARHLYVIRLPDSLAQYKTLVFDFMRERGIGVNVHYIPIHTQPYYQSLGVNYGDLTISENYYHSAISIPLYPGMTIADQDTVIKTLREVIDNLKSGSLL